MRYCRFWRLIWSCLAALEMLPPFSRSALQMLLYSTSWMVWFKESRGPGDWDGFPFSSCAGSCLANRLSVRM